MKTGISLLDLKLGLRMLVRYPGLTGTGGLAIAFAIWVGAGTFEIVQQVIVPRLPLEQGARIVGIDQMDRASARSTRPTLHDFAAWEAGLTTVEELGAFRLLERNLIAGDGVGEPVEVAAMSPTGFSVARVPPLLGRHLVPADEGADAPAVAVIGHDLWQGRFGGDPQVVGTTIRLGSTVHTVVGVMPEGFAFPFSQRLWVPLRLDPLRFAPGEAPAVRVFGRLAPGITLREAQAEIAALGARMAADTPETHAQLRPQLLPYARSMMNIPPLALVGLGTINLFVVILLVLICGNVALLMFARAAAREADLAVRSALGATRARLIGQHFVEALLLSGVGALIGLAGLHAGLRWAFEALALEYMEVPFWIRPELSTTTLAYTLLLTLLAALVAGVVPGIKVSRGLRHRLQQASAGGGGFRFGGVWTVVIVSQVAITLLFPVIAVLLHRDTEEIRRVHAESGEEQVLAVRVEMDRGDAGASEPEEAFRARYAEAVRDLERRLAADPAVESITFGDRLPRMYHPHRLVELDEGAAAPLHPEWPAYRVSSASVEIGFFQSFNARILAGRAFQAADVETARPVVIVNRSFVERVFGGRNPIGRHLRYVRFEERRPYTPEESAREPWYEIIGVVPDVGPPVAGEHDPKVATFYHPVATGGVYPGFLGVRVKGDPAPVGSRIRAVATRSQPELRLYDIQTLDRANAAEVRFLTFWFWLSTAVSGVAIFLSLAGIYAVLAFTVTQRTREIGIRVALGGTAARVIRAIFRRPLAQLAIGIGVGAVLVTVFVGLAMGGRFTPGLVALLAGYVVMMTAVCMVACLVPARRALRVEPSEALRAEG